MTSSDTPAKHQTARNASDQGLAESQISDSFKTEVDAHQLKAEAAAVAAHLQRAGVQWLPNPEPTSTDQLASLFSSMGVPPAIDSDHATGSATTGSAMPHADAIPSDPTVKTTTHDPGTASPAPAPVTRRTDSNRPPSKRPAARLDGVSAINTATEEYPGDSLSTDQRTQQLQKLAQDVSACTQCAALASCRSKTVFGEGNQNPRVAFFGEGPGADEDRTGRPFVGESGELLTRMMQACTFRREDVYILNTVKCRPPGNRNPELEELENCRGYYVQQLNVLRPEYIVCLGAVSAQELLKTKLSVGRLRGNLHRYFASKVLVTYHPAYLLRNPAAKKAAWADLQLLMRDAGITPPKY